MELPHQCVFPASCTKHQDTKGHEEEMVLLISQIFEVKKICNDKETIIKDKISISPENVRCPSLRPRYGSYVCGHGTVIRSKHSLTRERGL